MGTSRASSRDAEAEPHGAPCANLDQTPTPLFKVVPSMLQEEDRTALADFAATSLGDDPSSKHFMPRKKSIAFVVWIDGEVYCLKHNYFWQPEKYNDFSGGYKRFYETLPDELVQGHMRDVIAKFAETYNLPNYACILVQLQSSTIEAGSDLPVNGTSITGQGIHTDGHDRAVLICIERKNVLGAENSLFADLDGKQELLSPTTLGERDALFFKDNSLYHYVEDAAPANSKEDMNRTMLIVHYPAGFTLNGSDNPENKLLTSASPLRLREAEPLANN